MLILIMILFTMLMIIETSCSSVVAAPRKALFGRVFPTSLSLCGIFFQCFSSSGSMNLYIF